MPKPCSLELRERGVEATEFRRIATGGRVMVRGEPELGHQNGRSGSPQAERGEHLVPGGTRGLVAG